MNSETKQSATTAGNSIASRNVQDNSDQPSWTTSTQNTEQTGNPELPSAIVAFYGDSQSDCDEDDANHTITVGHIMKSQANPIFHLGDLMEDGTQESLDRFNLVTQKMRSSRIFYAAIGNNERNSARFFNNFQFPNNERWFSVNIGNLHAIVLDSAYSPTEIGSAQYEWLLSDLQSHASQQRFTVVLFHHPPYGVAGDTKGLINTIVPLFRDNGVDFVISGHEHVYQKRIVEGVPYYVTSGQPMIGYFVANVYNKKTQLDYFNSSGVLVESSIILPR